jgi:hypothetical protein
LIFDCRLKVFCQFYKKIERSDSTNHQLSINNLKGAAIPQIANRQSSIVNHQSKDGGSA